MVQDKSYDKCQRCQQQDHPWLWDQKLLPRTTNFLSLDQFDIKTTVLRPQHGFLPKFPLISIPSSSFDTKWVHHLSAWYTATYHPYRYSASLRLRTGFSKHAVLIFYYHCKCSVNIFNHHCNFLNWKSMFLDKIPQPNAWNSYIKSNILRFYLSSPYAISGFRPTVKKTSLTSSII